VNFPFAGPAVPVLYQLCKINDEFRAKEKNRAGLQPLIDSRIDEWDSDRVVNLNLNHEVQAFI